MEPTQAGLALISVGVILIGIALILILIGQYRTVKDPYSWSLPYLDKRALRGLYNYSITPFTLKRYTRIDGKVIPINGPFDFFLHDYFGWIPPGQIQWLAPSYVRLVDLTAGNEPTFEVFMQPGDYMFMFRTKTQNVEGEVELSFTEYIKSFSKLIDVGLALLQVAVPILVTGFVIYIGLTVT